MNNCYECKYRKGVTGSAHSECTHPAFDPPNNFLFALAVAQGLKLTSDQGVLLEFDEHGVRNGWCTFPINFDPTWVKCNLPL